MWLFWLSFEFLLCVLHVCHMTLCLVTQLDVLKCGAMTHSSKLRYIDLFRFHSWS